MGWLKVPISVNFSDEEIERIKTEADNEGRPMSNFIRFATLRYLEGKDSAGVGKSQ